MRPGAIFLDRDGVVCENRPTYVRAWGDFRWLPGAREALHLLGHLPLPVVMITNQSAINRGLTTADAVDDMHRRMWSDIQQGEGRLDAIYICPHRPDEACSCRKPGLLLFRKAETDLGVDLGRSYLIGDSLSDLQAGWDLNMRVLLVRTGLGEETAARLDGGAQGVQIMRDFLEAAQTIAADVNRGELQLSDAARR